MPYLIDIDGKLRSTAGDHISKDYEPLKIGKPLAIELLTFYPGHIKDDWGGKSEILLTTQIRDKPRSKPGPQYINMMLKGYDYKAHRPITNYGDTVSGDKMIYYTKAYLGQDIGLTINGYEMDKIGESNWNKISDVISKASTLAYFTPAASLLLSINLGTKFVKLLANVLSKNDRLVLEWIDLNFNGKNRNKLKSGRYIFFSDNKNKEIKKIIRNNYRLTRDTDEDYEPNILIETKTGKEFESLPYIVIEVSPSENKAYEDYEIGAGSAKIIEEYGINKQGITLENIKELAQNVNDAKQLSKLKDLVSEYDDATDDANKALVKSKIDAQTQLFSNINQDFVKDIISSVIK